ncbi:MAG: hypothetical protein AAF734_05045, partial [Bacteroidota bacterium]
MNLNTLLPSETSIQQSLSIDVAVFDRIFKAIDEHLARYPHEAIRKDFVQLLNFRAILQNFDSTVKEEKEDHRKQLLWLRTQLLQLLEKIEAAPRTTASSTSNDTEEEDWSWLLEPSSQLSVMPFIKFLPFLKAEFEGQVNILKRVARMEEILYFFEENLPVDSYAQQEQQNILLGIQKEMRLMLTERTIKLGSGEPSQVREKWQQILQTVQVDLADAQQAGKVDNEQDFKQLWT